MSSLKEETLQFLIDLKWNNNREWFDQNRNRYQEAKTDFEKFVQKLIDELHKHWNIKGVEAKECIYRIFKDVRFSKDKTPYKAEFGATIGPKGKKSSGAGIHLYIRPADTSFVDVGTCHLEPVDLKKVRSEIEYDSSTIRDFLSSEAFQKVFNGELKGEKVKTAPKGYDKAHPEIDLLKHKNFNVRSEFPTSNLVNENFEELFLEILFAGKPLIEFVNSSILDE